MRLFVAVWPSEEVLAAVAALARPEVKGLRWTSRDQWHVTLRFLGEVEDVEAAVAAFSAIDAEAVEAVMGPETGRFGWRVLHVPVAGLEQLARVATSATEEIGKPPERRRFSGHLTLARGRDRNVDLRGFSGIPLAGRWPVNELTLVASRLHPHGARYEVVARRPLG